MALYLFVAILAICLLTVLQASPLPNGNQATDLQQDFGSLILGFGEAVGQAVNSALDNPTLKQLVQNGTAFVKSGVDTMAAGFDSLIPKTQ